MNTLVVPKFSDQFQVSISPEADLRKKELLEESSFFEAVASPSEQQEAVNMLAKLKGFAGDVEKTRKDVKQPYLDACRVIDAAAAKAAKEVDYEIVRISGIVKTFQIEEQKRMEAERRKAEQERIEQERKIAQARREAEEAERKRIEAERAQQIAKTKKEQEEAARKLAEAEKAEEAAKDKSMDVEIAAMEQPVVVVKEAAKAKGMAVKVEYDYEITDIDALYSALPRLVDLTPRKAEIRIHINSPGVSHDIPGLRIFEDVKLATRKVSQQEGNFLR